MVSAALAAGCSASRSSAPRVTLVRRDVTVLVADSTGAPVAGLFVRATALPDSGGFGALATGTTGPDGTVRFAALLEGAWAFACVAPGAPARAAGATTTVPGAERDAADTLLVRLALGTESSAGTVRLLANATDHAGTLVHVVETGALAVTGADGACVLGPLPVGRWTLSASRTGYATHYAPFEVTTPGSLLALPPITLRWIGSPSDTSIGHS